MNRGVLYRVVLFAVLTLGAFVYLAPSIPTISAELPGWWTRVFSAQRVRLGLDLQGGTHLLLTVDLDKAIETTLDRSADELRRDFREEQVGAVALAREGHTLRLTLGNPERRADVERLLRERFPNLAAEAAVDAARSTFVLTLDRREEQRLREYALDQSLETIRNRIDQFGVAEPNIQRQGSQEILVQLPGIQEPQRAKELIGKTALPEFKILAEGAKYQGATPEQPAPGTESIEGIEVDPVTQQIRRIKYLVESRTLMTGDAVSDARVRPAAQLEGPYVELILSPRGAKIFEDLTAENVGRRLAIILDGTVYSAPVIRARIAGGRAQITGNFDIKEARDLAIVLRAGALPAPVRLIEERTVGPSLGRDSIRRGVVSFAVGGSLVVLFMLVYYRLAGLLADIALVLNVVYLLAALAGLGATLTLPGIAGIVLTLGMAVDANVLINERIREELRLGKTARAAIQAGFERALPAILDSNITTFLSGLILFQFGSGPVKGFAVTLCIGLASSVLTAVVGTRTVYDYLLSGRRLERVSI
jgi:preprotein translocase subunit SecD